MDNKRKNLEDLATHNRIHDHLSNKSDVISEEDIRNAKTGDFEEEKKPGSDTAGNLENEEVEKPHEAEKEGEDDEDTGLVTPWNILGS